MGRGVVQISPFISMMIGLLFTFSTIWGLMFYYNQGASQTLSVEELSGDPNDPASLNSGGGFISSFVSGIADTILSFIAWISPFAIVRGAILVISPTDLFNIIDIFILRPMSWAVSIITANYIISNVRGKSEGT